MLQGFTGARMAQATLSASQALKTSIAHIGTIGGVSVSIAEEQRRLSAAGLKYVAENHDTPAVCRVLDRCYARL